MGDYGDRSFEVKKQDFSMLLGVFKQKRPYLTWCFSLSPYMSLVLAFIDLVTGGEEIDPVW